MPRSIFKSRNLPTRLAYMGLSLSGVGRGLGTVSRTDLCRYGFCFTDLPGSTQLAPARAGGSCERRYFVPLRLELHMSGCGNTGERQARGV